MTLKLLLMITTTQEKRSGVMVVEKVESSVVVLPQRRRVMCPSFDFHRDEGSTYGGRNGGFRDFVGYEDLCVSLLAFNVFELCRGSCFLLGC